jgi:hypothetical protein
MIKLENRCRITQKCIDISFKDKETINIIIIDV